MAKIVSVVAQGDVHDANIPMGFIALHVDMDSVSETYDKHMGNVCYVAFAHTLTCGDLWVFSKTPDMSKPYVLETVDTHKTTECDATVYAW